MQRRALLAATLAAPALPHALRAQETWPNRSVSVLLGYPPGGVTDFAARGIVDRMGRELGQTLVVDNRPGAATAVANNAAAQARPDGYTLLMGTSTLAINPALQPNLQPRDPVAALTPIGTVFRTAFILHVHPSLPVRSMKPWPAAEGGLASMRLTGVMHRSARGVASLMLRRGSALSATLAPVTVSTPLAALKL